MTWNDIKAHVDAYTIKNFVFFFMSIYLAVEHHELQILIGGHIVAITVDGWGGYQHVRFDRRRIVNLLVGLCSFTTVVSNSLTVRGFGLLTVLSLIDWPSVDDFRGQ